MIRSLLVRGLLAGVVAGLAAAAVAFGLGEPQLERAIRWESAEHAAGADAHDHALVARDVQRTAGLATGGVATGAALGGLLALAFAAAYGRVGRLGPRATAVLLAGGAFVAIALVPFLAYPPNPPGVGDTATVRERTALHLVAIAVALLAAWAGLAVWRAARARRGPRDAGLLGAATFALALVAALSALPLAEGAPDGFPADVLWRFRLASLATNAALWAVLGIVFGAAAKRLVARKPAPTSSTAAL